MQREAYLLELARYVMLNPVRAVLCSLPGDWHWSSYLAMVWQAPRPVWLHTDWLLAQFGMRDVAAYVDDVPASLRLPSVPNEVVEHSEPGKASVPSVCKAVQDQLH